MYNPVKLEHLGVLVDTVDTCSVYRFSGFFEKCWIHFCLHKKNLIVMFSDKLCLLSVRAVEELSEGHETYIPLIFYSKFSCTSAVTSHG